MQTPQMLGIVRGGVLSVIYSPIGLGTQWDGVERPFAKCYSPQDGLRIGMNVIVYAMTH